MQLTKVGLLLALLAAQDYITVSTLFGVQFVVSIMSVLSDPATIAMLPDIVEDEDLTRANSLLGAIHIPPQLEVQYWEEYSTDWVGYR